MLFRTVGLAPAGEVTLSARVQAHNAFSTRLGVLSTLHPFGGERRLVHWQSKAQGPDGWSCPPSLVEALTKTPYLRMVLATPAVFKGGWKPGWLGDGLNGTPPVAGAPPMRLVGACLDRWRPISGWDMRVRARKGIRRLVPAGGVYFFRADAQLTADVARRLWLQPVCDEPQDQRDGFGLALWGVGQPTEGGE
jgi:CRISPR-associated protein Cmr3